MKQKNHFVDVHCKNGALKDAFMVLELAKTKEGIRPWIHICTHRMKTQNDYDLCRYAMHAFDTGRRAIITVCGDRKWLDKEAQKDFDNTPEEYKKYVRTMINQCETCNKILKEIDKKEVKSK